MLCRLLLAPGPACRLKTARHRGGAGGSSFINLPSTHAPRAPPAPAPNPAPSALPAADDQTDVAYQEVKEVQTVGRMLGAWGDIIVTLKDNSKIEIRMLDK